MKRCPACSETKPLSEFGVRSGARAGKPRGQCKACENAAVKRRQAQNPAQVTDNMRRQIERRRVKDATVPGHLQSRVDYAREWRQRNPERWKAHQERAALKRLYGVTVEAMKALLVEQGHACAICRDGLTWETRHIDHIDTPEGPVVRGLLCMGCNTALGRFRDDPEIIRRAALYVEAHLPVEQVI